MKSHPVRGAWIEIQASVMGILFDRESHPVRGAWIEIADGRLQTRTYEKSHPVRGAWIEISYHFASGDVFSVASRKGCVD